MDTRWADGGAGLVPGRVQDRAAQVVGTAGQRPRAGRALAEGWREVGEEEGVHDKAAEVGCREKSGRGPWVSLEMLNSILCANTPLKESVSLRAVG